MPLFWTGPRGKTSRRAGSKGTRRPGHRQPRRRKRRIRAHRFILTQRDHQGARGMANRAFARQAGRTVRTGSMDASSGMRRVNRALPLQSSRPSSASQASAVSSSPDSIPSPRSTRPGSRRSPIPLSARASALSAAAFAERGFASAAHHDTDANPVAAPGTAPDTGRETPGVSAMSPRAQVFVSGNPAPMGAIDMEKPWRSLACDAPVRGARVLLRQESQIQTGRM